MNIKFTNGKKVDYITALETEEYYNGASRRTLTVECKIGAVSVDELNNILSDENNTVQMVFEGDKLPVYKEDERGNSVLDHYETAKSIYDNYSLKLMVGVEPVLIKSETPESSAVYEDRIKFKMGRRTYIEQRLKEMNI